MDVSILGDVSGFRKHQLGFVVVKSKKLNYVINLSDFKTKSFSTQYSHSLNPFPQKVDGNGGEEEEEV